MSTLLPYRNLPVPNFEIEPWPLRDAPEAIVAGITGDIKGGPYYLTIGPGDHTCARWRLTESLARKLRRELNERLD